MLRGRFHGNLLELLEPGYARLLAPLVLDNDRFPDDWHARTTACGGACESCGYCREVFKRVALRPDERARTSEACRAAGQSGN